MKLRDLLLHVLLVGEGWNIVVYRVGKPGVFTLNPEGPNQEVQWYSEEVFDKTSDEIQQEYPDLDVCFEDAIDVELDRLISELKMDPEEEGWVIDGSDLDMIKDYLNARIQSFGMLSLARQD